MAYWRMMCCPVVCFASSWCQEDASDISSLCADALHARVQCMSYTSSAQWIIAEKWMHSMHTVHIAQCSQYAHSVHCTVCTVERS